MRYRRRKKKNLYLRKYFFVVSFLVGIFSLMFTTGMFLYFNTLAAPHYDPQKQALLEEKANAEFLSSKKELILVSTTYETETTIETTTETITEDTIDIPRKTNFLIAGVDKDESLTDVIMVGSFDAVTKKINILSIPRDTYIVLEQEEVKKLKSRSVPSSGVMKINSVNVYAGKKYGMPFLENEIEEILGIKIKYYVKINLDGFKSVVDTIGGVEFEVQDRLYYDDPTQNLHINLYPGVQVLNGKKAEGLVRFRHGYATQDIQRMNVQQEFLKQFAKQLMKKETIKSNITGLVSDFLKYVDTDFGIGDIAKYAKYANGINGDSINTSTLPGEAKTIDGISYFIHDKYETSKIVQEFFYNTDTQESSNTEN